MIASRILTLRPWLAAVLILALSIAGLGRGWAAASAGLGMAPVIAGVAVPICHGDGGSAPDTPDQHDCCDLCALCTPVLLPEAPHLTAPAGVARYAAHALAIGWAPILLRPRTPRLAQGPPAA